MNDDLTTLVRKITENVTVVNGPTGSGKSLYIPSGIAYNNKDGKTILVAIPTVDSVMALYERCSLYLRENHSSITVGYAADERVEYVLGKTSVVYATTGHVRRLFERMFSNGKLTDSSAAGDVFKISYLIIDEAHTGSVDNTMISGYWRNMSFARPKLIVMSATISAKNLPLYLGINYIPSEVSLPVGRYNTQVVYSQQNVSTENAAIKAAIGMARKYAQAKDGHIIVFVSGMSAINTVIDQLSTLDADIIAYHGSLKSEKMLRRLTDNTGSTKVIVSTNALESSITVPGVKYVIDTMYEKVTALTTASEDEVILLTSLISQTSALQRSGRTGRTNNGIVYRCMTATQYARLTVNNTPRVMLSAIHREVMAIMITGLSVVDILRPPVTEKELEKLSLKVERVIMSVQETTMGNNEALSFMSFLKLGIKPSYYVWKSLKETTGLTMLKSIVVACLLSKSPSDYWETKDASKVSQFIGNTDVLYLYSLWTNLQENLSSVQMRDPSSDGHYEWCIKNAVSHSAIVKLEKSILHTIRRVRDVRSDFDVTADMRCSRFLVKDRNRIMPALLEVYNSEVVTLKKGSYKNAKKGKLEYVIGKGILHSVNQDGHPTIVVLNTTANSFTKRTVNIYEQTTSVEDTDSNIALFDWNESGAPTMDTYVCESRSLVEAVEDTVINAFLSLIASLWATSDTKVYNFKLDVKNITGEQLDIAGTATVQSIIEKLYDIYRKTPLRQPWGVVNPKRLNAAKFKAVKVTKWLGGLPSLPNYVDIGSGDGAMATAMIDYLKPSKVSLLDVENYLGDSLASYYVNLIPNEKLQMEAETVDVITMFQTMHHAEDLKYRLSEIARVLKQGSFLCVSDHDINEDFEMGKVLMEHILYELAELGDRNLSLDEFSAWVRSFSLNLMSGNAIVAMLKNAGLDLIVESRTVPTKVDYTTYMVFQKR